MNKSVLPLAACVAFSLVGQLNQAAISGGRLITASSAGVVQIGMTVSAIRKAVKGFQVKRTSDGDGVALIEVSHKNRPVMNLYAGEADPTARINERAVVVNIEVFDSSFSTKAGVHPGMSLKAAERIYGKVTQVQKSEIESREFATFAKAPAGFSFMIRAKEGFAGNYSYQKDQSIAKSFVPSAYVYSITIYSRRK